MTIIEGDVSEARPDLRRYSEPIDWSQILRNGNVLPW